MRQQHIRDVARCQPMHLQPILDGLALAEGADVDQHYFPMPAQQRNGAPTQPAMADRVAGIALDDDVDPPPVDLVQFFNLLRSHLRLPLTLADAHIDALHLRVFRQFAGRPG